MRPTARRDGYRAPGLADALVSGFAAAIDNIAPGFENRL